MGFIRPLVAGSFCMLPVLLAAWAPEGIGLDQLEKKAGDSRARLEAGPARWTMRATTATGAKFGLRIVSAPPDFEARILLKPDTNRPEPFARVVARNGKWAVEEFGGLKGIYRPWEAPFSYELVALLLSEAWPPPYVRSDEHVLKGTIGDTVTVRAPLSDRQRRLAESFLEEAAGMGVQPGPGSELGRNLKAIRTLLQEGNRLRVDRRTGLMERVVLGEMQLEYSRVEWMNERPEIPNLNSYPDFSAPLPDDRDGLIMIGRTGSWRPGHPEMSSGGQLLNIETGKMTRIPFMGMSCQPGCFSDQRGKVVVTAREHDGSGVGLHLIDLQTGEQMRLGGAAFAGGICNYPVLSPDGRTLAVTFSRRKFTRQIYFLTPEDKDPRPVGAPHDIRGLSWLGDGSGLIGLIGNRDTEAAGPGKAWKIVRFDRQGVPAVIRSNVGSFALVAGRHRDLILFQDHDGLCYTSDREGREIRKVGDGLRDLASPAVSPEGGHVVMLARDEKKQSWPVVVDLESGKRFPVKVERGRWLSPAWR